MRQIVHPGPATKDRVAAVPGTPVPLHFVLQPGDRVDEAIAKGLEAVGCVGGFVALSGGQCDPLRYVMPAASPDAEHAAWYSRTFEPAGCVGIIRACAIAGVRDEKPFIHCHGIWGTGDDRWMGHLLASATLVAEPIEVMGIGVREATFKAMPDPETNFTLFEPAPAAQSQPGATGRQVLLAKVRPNMDICLAIEEICARHGIERARVHGIGSLNGVRFVDGTRVNSHATEVLIENGIVRGPNGQRRAQLVIDVVDMEGAIFSGELVRGDNPVCVTFELVIEPVND